MPRGVRLDSFTEIRLHSPSLSQLLIHSHTQPSLLQDPLRDELFTCSRDAYIACLAESRLPAWQTPSHRSDCTPPAPSSLIFTSTSRHPLNFFLARCAAPHIKPHPLSPQELPHRTTNQHTNTSTHPKIQQHYHTRREQQSNRQHAAVHRHHCQRHRWRSSLYPCAPSNLPPLSSRSRMRLLSEPPCKTCRLLQTLMT